MVYDPELLDQLEALDTHEWRGTVWRHMFAGFPPERTNTGGARWNPPGVAAIYTSIDRATAIAEGDYASAVQPLRPKTKRTVYELSVQVHAMADLTTPGALQAIGIGEAELSEVPSLACQTVGGAVAWLGCDGLLVPSARADGNNLVIFVNQQDPDSEFEIVSSEVLEDP